MTDAQKAAMRAALDQILEQTIASYHGFMESTVHSKAEALLDGNFRDGLIEQLAAAADSATPEDVKQ
jgi:hypothetical protein